MAQFQTFLRSSVLAAMFCAEAACASAQTIDQMTARGTALSTDLYECRAGGVSYKCTASQAVIAGGALLINTITSPTFTVSGATNIWFGTNSYTNSLINWASASNTVPEVGSETIITANTGSANAGTAFKVAQFDAVSCSSGSANCYGGNDIVQANSGFPSLLTGREIDLNWNAGAGASTPGGTNAAYNLVLAGTAASASYQATAAMWITGVLSNPVWANGVYLSTGIKNNGIVDASADLTSYLITGTHTTGMDTTFATLTDALNMAAGQRICLSSNTVCISYGSGASKIYFTNASGTNIASIDSSGNMKILGTLTQSTTP